MRESPLPAQSDSAKAPAPGPVPTGRLRRVVKGVLTLAVLGLAVLFLARNLSWEDVARLPDGTTGRLHTESGKPALLVLSDGTPQPLTAAQEASLVRVRGVRSTIASARPSAVGVAVLLMLLAIGAVAVRWRALLALLGEKVSLREAWKASFDAQGLSLLLPGAVGGDVYRVGWLMSRGGSASRATLSVVADRLVGLGVFVVSVGMLARGSPLTRDWPLFSLLPWATLAGAVAAGLALLRLPQQWVPARVRGQLLVFRSAVRERPGQLLLATGCSLANTALHCASILVVLSSFAPELPAFQELVFATVLGMLANALPLSPSGIGVGEAAFVYLFGQSGIAASDVLATTLLVRAVTFGFAAVAVAGFLKSSLLRSGTKPVLLQP